ncbi:MAG: HEAT repeat domain-containing protein [Candidatus Acidiferrales bacterium]
MPGTMLLGFFLWLTLFGVVLSGTPFRAFGSITPQSSQGQSTEDELRATIDSVIRDTVNKGTGRTAEGVPYYVEMPPLLTDTDRKKIRDFGAKSLAILEEHVWTSPFREARVAIQLVAELGRDDGLKALARIVKRHPSPQMRIRALRLLSGDLKSSFFSTIKDAADTDPDETVRRVAKEILSKK